MTTLAQLANDYWQTTLSDSDKLRTQIQGLAKDNNINLSDLYSLFSSTANFTGSGRQGSGLQSLDDIWFDPNSGYAALGGRDQLSNSITSTSSRDGGWNFYDPYAPVGLGMDEPAPWSDNGNLPDNDPRGTWNPEMQAFIPRDSGGLVKYDQLSPQLQQQLRTSGLFPNIDESSLKGNRDLPSQFSLDQTGSIMEQYLNLEKQRIGNTGKPESNSWLMNSGIGTLFSGLGSALGIPFLNLAGNITNTGQAIENEQWGSALMGGLGAYNTSAGIVNNANFSNVNPEAMGSPVYETFNPSQYVAQDVLGIENPTLGQYVGNAAVDSGVAALNGSDVGDALRNSLINTTVTNVGQELGLPSMVSGMLGSGLSYLYNQPQGSSASSVPASTTPPSTTTPPATTTPTPFTPPAGTAAPPPYSLTNPTTIPSYTNPFANVPSPYTQSSFGQPLMANYEEGADDESDTNNPYNTFVNYSGSGQNIYG